MNDIYIQALVGGMVLGLGAALLMFTLGKIAGISGITFSAITSYSSTNLWRWAFLVGLIIAPIITAQFGYKLPTEAATGIPLLIIAGLLVGIGTKVGSGCTSGHGICGIGRFSKRSIIATITFMFTAFVTVFITHHLF
ncbi:YeeE/YedE family protein [Aliiglaciecola lipolytica]|uniref:Sulphur transport domain-containing protein n=1 Tax=Aliiglaciecola lipolytica E3 TaxID=1127673 RepID=K6Y6J4_9ALTE|nr:hypothetical protein [Aliiglaciecola lipolytica]GAC13822.1 hypothetical protein GLIP_1181 [Aliiglaciecola lipolytica E3]